MNKGFILLFLLTFGVASTGQVGAQAPSMSHSPEGVAAHTPIPVGAVDKDKLHANHPEAKVKVKVKVKCDRGGKPPFCVI